MRLIRHTMSDGDAGASTRPSLMRAPASKYTVGVVRREYVRVRCCFMVVWFCNPCVIPTSEACDCVR